MRQYVPHVSLAMNNLRNYVFWMMEKFVIFYVFGNGTVCNNLCLGDEKVCNILNLSIEFL